MSTLWTPGGEYQPKSEEPASSRPAQDAFAGQTLEANDSQDAAADFGEDGQEGARAEAERVAGEIRQADPAIIVANHCYGFFELAAVHLSSQPPNLLGAALAIDALGGVLGEVGDRLGDYLGDLRDALAQLRLAYVQLSSVASPPANPGGDSA